MIDLAAQGVAEAKARAAKVEQAKAQIAARRALKRKATADGRAAQAAAYKKAIPEYWTAFGQAFPTGPARTSWRDEPEFLAALAKLCDLYGVAISGCGCCGSPFLSTIDPGQTLVAYTNRTQLEPVLVPKDPHP